MVVGAIVGIIFTVIIALITIVVGIYLILDDNKAGGITTLIITIIVSGVIIGGTFFWQFGTEGGKRALKTQESDFNGGIERTVRVYDIQGDLIATYSGKFDVESNTLSPTPYIIFDDENGKRHMIYYPTGTMIIDEK